MRIFLKLHASLFSFLGILLLSVSVFLCFLGYGATSLFGEDASLFDMIFGMNEPVLIGLVFAFVFLLLTIVMDFVSFLFSRQGKKSDIRLSSRTGCIGFILSLVSSILFACSPLYTEIYSLGPGPFLVAGTILVSQLFQLPNILFPKL